MYLRQNIKGLLLLQRLTPATHSTSVIRSASIFLSLYTDFHSMSSCISTVSLWQIIQHDILEGHSASQHDIDRKYPSFLTLLGKRLSLKSLNENLSIIISGIFGERTSCCFPRRSYTHTPSKDQSQESSVSSDSAHVVSCVFMWTTQEQCTVLFANSFKDSSYVSE